MMGSETRLICILKENNYNVICPNNILVCMHHHKIKLFRTRSKIMISSQFWGLKNVNGMMPSTNYCSNPTDGVSGGSVVHTESP